MPRTELRDDRGRILGYSYSCSRDSTAALCKFCERGGELLRCEFKSRAGVCNVYVCPTCAASKDDEVYCPVHRERAGLGPPPSVARYRERRALKRKRQSAPPRWIESSLYPARCKDCGAQTEKGHRILYFPDRTLMCAGCGEQFKRDEAESKKLDRLAAADEWDAGEVYETSDGALTRKFLLELEQRGPAGVVAALLFKAQKASRRAKRYGGAGRGRLSFRELSYERKGESLKELTAALTEHGAALGITFGWGRDEGQCNPWVLYVDLPGLGQVSFHSPERYDGPDYPGEWDGARASEERIINFCQKVIDA